MQLRRVQESLHHPLPPEPQSDIQTLEHLRLNIEQSVGCAFRVGGCDLRGPTRGRAQVALARQVSMYLAHVAYGLTLTDVGRMFQRDRTTVSHACIVVEDRRDQPDFDRSLDLLESVLRAHARRAGIDLAIGVPAIVMHMEAGLMAMAEHRRELAHHDGP